MYALPFHEHMVHGIYLYVNYFGEGSGMVQLNEQQKAAMKPVVDRIRQLKAAHDEQLHTLVRMSGMVEPRVFDPTSGVRFNIDTLTFTYPPSENGDGDPS